MICTKCHAETFTNRDIVITKATNNTIVFCDSCWADFGMFMLLKNYQLYGPNLVRANLKAFLTTK